MADEGEDLVAIGIAGDPMEAGMAREFLRSNGIECMIQGEHHRSMLQNLGPYVELRLLVPTSQAEEAAALLADFRSQVAEREDMEDEEDEEAVEERPLAEPIDWRKDPTLVRKVRGARLLSLMVPGFGIGHFAVGATLRGLVLLAAWPLAFWLARSLGPKAGALIPASALIDFLATPAAMTSVMRRRERDRLPRARISSTRGG